MTPPAVACGFWCLIWRAATPLEINRKQDLSGHFFSLSAAPVYAESASCVAYDEALSLPKMHSVPSHHWFRTRWRRAGPVHATLQEVSEGRNASMAKRLEKMRPHLLAIILLLCSARADATGPAGGNGVVATIPGSIYRWQPGDPPPSPGLLSIIAAPVHVLQSHRARLDRKAKDADSVDRAVRFPDEAPRNPCGKPSNCPSLGQ
jgi:hypothetical protein